MATNKLKDVQLKNARAGDKEQLLADGAGLYARIRAAHESKPGEVTISFRLVYRLEGKQKWLTLGGYPEMGLQAARAAAAEARASLAQGTDPALGRRLEKERNRAAQLEEAEALKRQAARITVRELFDRWRGLELAKRKDSSRLELERAFRKDVLPALGALAAEDVSKAHITGILDAILARGANRLANRTLAEMRQMFGFGYARDIIKADPTHGLTKGDVGGKDTERSRVLSEAEIAELARRMPGAGLLASTKCAIWAMLATGIRTGDLVKAKWSEIDWEARTWVFEPEKDQAHISRKHTIFLSDFALGQFKKLHEISGAGEYLFPDREGKKPVSKKSITKQVGDRQRTEGLQNRSKLTASLLLPGGSWTPHDLRRSFATLAVELGVSPGVADLCLYHIPQNKIARIYNRAKQEKEQAECWRAVGERLEILTGEGMRNVIPFRKTGR
jgi:integrase